MLFFVAITSCIYSLPAEAIATVPYRMNFQGKLADASGIAKADGVYNMKLRLYNQSNALVWSEDRLVAAGNGVTLVGGLFTIQLGSISALDPALFSTANQASLSLEVELPTPATATSSSPSWTEGAMTPRNPLASSTYAFNSDTLDGMDSAVFAQRNSANTFTIDDANALRVRTAGGQSVFNVDTQSKIVQIENLRFGNGTMASGASIYWNAYWDGSAVRYMGTGPMTDLYSNDGGWSFMTAPSGAANSLVNERQIFGLTNTGDALFQGTTQSTSAFAVKNDAGLNLFSVDTTNSAVHVGNATADASSTLLVLDNSSATDPTGRPGGMYYNTASSKFRCYENSAWKDCIGAGGSSTLQQAYDTSSSPATITTTAAKGVSVAAGAVPTATLFTVDNTAQPTVTNNANGMAVKYAGGAAAVEGSGLRVDYTPGTTTGGTWNGVRIVANATGPANGVRANGLKLEGPTAPGNGTEVGVAVGTGWDIGVDIQSGGLQLAAQNDPSPTAAGNLRIYAKDIAGRVMPKWIGPSGVDTPMQASLGFNRISMVMPAGGSTLTTFVGGFGTTFTNTGTAANPVPNSTNMLSSVRRATFSSGATAGTVASHRQSVLQVWRGNTPGRGGFFYTIRFGTSSLQAGNRAFVGLADAVAAPTNVDPLTATAPGKIGVAINSNTGNWQLINNVTGAAPAVLDLGSTLPLNTTDLYELILYSPPNGSSIGYRVKNLSTNAQATGSLSTNIPASTTFLAPQFWITNNATAAAAVLDFSGWYLESDL